MKIIDISDPVNNIKITCNECQTECYPTLALWGKDCMPDICDKCVQKGWIPVEYPEEAKQKHKEWNAKSRKLVLDYYGAKCVCCGKKESCFLSIDHINNDGAKHRKEIRNKQTIYVWLRKNNYPTGFQILCYNCNMAKAFYGTCPHKK